MRGRFGIGLLRRMMVTCQACERTAMKPSIALASRRTEVRAAASRFRATNPRVFGSVARGTDGEGSDLDLLVEALPGATLFDLGGLQDELERMLGVRVDVVTPADLSPRYRDQILAEALSL